MLKKLSILAASFALVTGCATVPLEEPTKTEQALTFAAPQSGNAGVYIYRRANIAGTALKKDLWINGDCVGESAPGVFFYREVPGNQEHVIATESEFSPNEITLATTPGELHFIEQYIKMGLFVGGANVAERSAEEGRKAVAKLSLAKSGHCSDPR